MEADDIPCGPHHAPPAKASSHRQAWATSPAPCLEENAVPTTLEWAAHFKCMTAGLVDVAGELMSDMRGAALGDSPVEGTTDEHVPAEQSSMRNRSSSQRQVVSLLRRYIDVDRPLQNACVLLH